VGRLENKVAVVTGAGSGIGRAMAIAFAREGAFVAVTDIDADAADASRALIEAEGGEAMALCQDVASESGWDDALDDVVARRGRLDVLVNNAGIYIAGSVEAASFADWRRVMSVNLDGMFLGVRAAVRQMKGTGGSIINLSSMSAVTTTTIAAAYSASKAGVLMLTKAAAIHCAEAGYRIRVNSILPGPTATEMIQSMKGDPATLPTYEAIVRSVPLGRLADPDEIAMLGVYLASDESPFMTGSELLIDGAFTVR
jgi:3(or 17)beta-hydroxysteroid dehydrogenase